MGPINWIAVLAAALVSAAVLWLFWRGPLRWPYLLQIVPAAMLGHALARIGPEKLAAKPHLYFMQAGGLALAIVIPAPQHSVLKFQSTVFAPAASTIFSMETGCSASSKCRSFTPAGPPTLVSLERQDPSNILFIIIGTRVAIHQPVAYRHAPVPQGGMAIPRPPGPGASPPSTRDANAVLIGARMGFG